MVRDLGDIIIIVATILHISLLLCAILHSVADNIQSTTPQRCGGYIIIVVILSLLLQNVLCGPPGNLLMAVAGRGGVLIFIVWQNNKKTYK